MDVFEIFRIKAVLPLIKGKLLDLGCGFNNLKRKYQGETVGVDVFDWGGKPDLVVSSTDELPFKNNSFDTITFLACLNHIPYREKTIKEAARLLKKDGQIIISMISPFAGKLAHFFEGKDELERDFVEGEVLGMTSQEIENLAKSAKLKIVKIKRIYCSPNKIYILKRI